MTEPEKPPRRFERTTGTSARYVWAPCVHESFGETCFFYLIRASDPGISTADTVSDVLQREQIIGYSLFSVYGFHDLLIRFWSDDFGKRRVLRSLRRELSVEDISEFRASTISYLFDDRLPANDQIDERQLQLVRQVARAAVSDRWEVEDESAFDELLAEGLLLRVPPPETLDAVKLYILLEPIRSLLYEAHELEEIVRATRATQMGSPSVYSGVGRFRFLIKALSSSFASVNAQCAPIYEKAQSMGYRPTTLLVAADSGQVESDLLAAVRHTSDIEDFVSQMAHVRTDIRMQVSSLTSEQLNALEQLVRMERARLGGTRFHSRFVRLVASSLAGDEEGVSDSLAFLSQIERDLRKMLVPMFMDHWGSQWYQSAVELVPSAEGSFSKWTLRQMLDLCRSAAAKWPGIRDVLHTVFGVDWETSARTIVDLRNGYAHGTVYDRGALDSFDGGWGKVLKEVLDAAEFHTRLELALGKK